MKKIIIAIVAIVIVVAVAYFGLNHITKSAPVATNPDPIKIGVMIYPDSGAFYIAQEKGFFKKYGVNVELVDMPVDNVLGALQANQVQIATPMTSDMMTIVADAGINAKQIMIPSSSDGADGLLVSNDIQKISDLKGKKVYLTLGYPEHFFFRYLAEQNGLLAKDVELVNLNTEEVGSSFAAGKINAGVTWEPWLSKAAQESKGGKILLTSHDVPGVMVCTVAARTDLIENRREDIKKIMLAYFDAARWWDNNINEGNQIAARHFNLTIEEFAPLKNKIKLANLQYNLDKFNKNLPLNIYELTNKASDYYFQDGIIKSKVTGDQVTDDSLLQEIHQ